MKIAIIRLTSLGDVIHAMASLQIIRRTLPDCSITWVADKRFADILDYHPDIQEIVKIDLRGLKKRRPLLKAIAAEYQRLAALGPFDVVIDLQGMIKSAAIAAILGGDKYGPSNPKEALAGLFYNHAIQQPQGYPAVCRAVTLVARSLKLDFQPSELTTPKPYLFWGSEDDIITNEYFSREQRNIIIVPGSSTAYKNYPPDKFAQLANLLRENILICHGNQQELAIATQIAEQSPHVRILPRLTLNQLKAAIGRTDLVIGADTGPMHMAWASGTPSITLFGSTPVCITPTEHNLIIKSKTSINTPRPHAKDTSVRDISVEEIMTLANRLLHANSALP
ncbi:MAG: lipopolysaccharide heptosyltransferase I [Desulfuromonadaceae bacterium]|nr:lipopolysaccharide heptosyltransferase I [Desulfuromonadaceae bacterium]